MKKLIILSILLLTNCTNSLNHTDTKIKSKYNTPEMRIMIDPRNTTPENYIAIQEALFSSGRWDIVDRSSAFRAIKKEQEFEHKYMRDRFNDADKWSWWGQLFGIRAVVVFSSECGQRKKWRWFATDHYKVCNQKIVLYDANTALTLAAIAHREEGNYGDQDLEVSWENAVKKFNKMFLAVKKREYIGKKLRRYKLISKERAVRNKEEQAVIEIENSGLTFCHATSPEYCHKEDPNKSYYENHKHVYPNKTEFERNYLKKKKSLPLNETPKKVDISAPKKLPVNETPKIESKSLAENMLPKNDTPAKLPKRLLEKPLKNKVSN